MTIDAINDRDYAVAMPEYDYAFWNAIKRKSHNENGAYLPLKAESKMTAALKRESVFRSLATIAYLRGPGGLLLAKNCVEDSCWTTENGMYTFGNGMGDFTDYNIKSHKLGTLLKYDELYMEDIEVSSIEEAGIASEPITLEKGEYFVLGDNRNNSEDSRFANIGNVKEEYMVGKAWFYFRSIGKMGFIK